MLFRTRSESDCGGNFLEVKQKASVGAAGLVLAILKATRSPIIRKASSVLKEDLRKPSAERRKVFKIDSTLPLEDDLDDRGPSPTFWRCKHPHCVGMDEQTVICSVMKLAL